VTIWTEKSAKALLAVLETEDGVPEQEVTSLLSKDVKVEVATVEAPIPAPVAKKPIPETQNRPMPTRNGYQKSEDVPLPEYVPEDKEAKKPVIFHLNWSDMLLKALEAINYRFRFNVRAERPEIQYQYDPDPQWVHFTGNLQKKIRCIMRDELLTRDVRAKKKTRPLTWNNEVWSVALGAACERVGVDRKQIVTKS